jgi:phenylalanyl-tRNA synthetase alpha chain
MSNVVILEKNEIFQIEFLEDGKFILENGSPNVLLLKLLCKNNYSMPKSKIIESLTKDIYDRAFSEAMKLKQINYDKSNDEICTTEKAKTIIENDQIQNDLIRFSKDPSIKSNDEKIIKQYSKQNKLIKEAKIIFWKVTKGMQFEGSNKYETNLTYELLASNNWEKSLFKPYNYNAKGKDQLAGGLHPLLKVRSQYRQLLLELGFQEMPTNCFVESSFWNFDSLFQPQQHPSRDAHDTFFLTHPKSSNVEAKHKDYFNRVKDVHEIGGYGSMGLKYKWSAEEANKNILRTHTTAISSKMLYALALEYKQTGIFKPTKYFSIDRVFRNESIDKTHLAEFHQIEGLIADRNIGLGHLMGTIDDFFNRIGIKKLRYKPTFNPYTEPSMEVYGWHEKLNKFVEIGNSGIFRPEMLQPMGLPEDVQVIAWGLSLERPTMINYAIDNIRELFGHEVKISDTQKSSVYCLLNKTHKL